jgi:DNA-directed RNA polymerase subunit RPC12/RpoP
MYSRHAVYGSDREKFDAWEEIIEALEAIPAADVAPVRHGRWIEEEDPNGDPYYVCSVCDAEFVCVEGTPDDNQYYYCPNCGARMDLEEETK